MNASVLWTAPLHLDCVKLISEKECIVSAYQYDTDDHKRHGGLYCICTQTGTVISQTNASTFDEGVFDFRLVANGDVLAACSDGTLRMFDSHSLREKRAIDACREMILAAGQVDTLYYGCTNGGKLFTIDSDDNVDIWQGHSAEVWWVSHFSSSRNNLVSCDDFGRVSIWDFLKHQSVWTCPLNVHGAGVCCVEEFSDKNAILTSSYDKHVRCFDWRINPFADPAWSFGLGSGVWRVRCCSARNIILAAAMHDGVHARDPRKPSESLWHIPTESIAYGVDLIGSVGVAVTFYDNRLLKFSIN